MAEEGNIGSAGPALAAHSKDGSAMGQSPASSATHRPNSSSSSIPPNQAFDELVRPVGEFVQENPFLTAVLSGTIGLLLGLMVRRR